MDVRIGALLGTDSLDKICAAKYDYLMATSPRSNVQDGRIAHVLSDQALESRAAVSRNWRKLIGRLDCE